MLGGSSLYAQLIQRIPGLGWQMAGQGQAWGLGWNQGLWTLILRVLPSLQEEEVVDEARPHFLKYRALLPKQPPCPDQGLGSSGSDLPWSGAGAGLGVPASALITRRLCREVPQLFSWVLSP